MRKFVNRVDHVVYLSSYERLEANIASLEAVTDAKLARCEKQDKGAVICVDWSAGLEIVAPFLEKTDINAALHARLATHGEGLLAVVYAVEDLEAHTAKLAAQGVEMGALMTNDGSEPWSESIVLREKFGPPIMGSWLVFSQIDYDDGVVKFVQV